MKISDIIIRTEKEKDYEAVIALNVEAFRHNDFSDGREGELVCLLRKSSAFIPELSIVAEYRNTIIGHILITRIKIAGEREWESLSLAPMCVKPAYHNTGIGKKLINEGLKRAEELGFDSVILIGHPWYYPKFGFVPASTYNLKVTFDAPDEAFMAKELKPGSLKTKGGLILFPPEFDMFVT
jgi:predicted N-acetyltransferase YhbS